MKERSNQIILKPQKKLTRYRNINFIDATDNKIDVIATPMTREKLLMYALMKFYKKSNTISQIAPIIERKSKISLRIIDWFVNTYAKEKSLALPTYHKKTGKIKNHVYIWNSYKNTLRSFHGEYFEIYKRSDIITLEYSKTKIDDPQRLDTTLAQLNFFKWALEHDIIQYIQENFNLLGPKLYISDRKYCKNRLPTKIIKEENNNDIEITVKWDQCESSKK